MMPQGQFLVMAPVATGQEQALRDLLASMNSSVGVVDPRNALVPFGQFDRLHFARLLILSDATEADIAVYRVPVPHLPPTLAFLGDCDGPGDAALADLATRAAPGLRRIFACCEGFDPDADLFDWLRRHQQAAAAAYVNTIGRTVRQIREEAALYEALSAHLSAPERAFGTRDPLALRRALLAFIAERQAAGDLVLSDPEPTPLGWWIGNLVNAVAGAALAVLLFPVALILSPIYLWLLRRHELADPEIMPRPDPVRRATIASREDHDVTNPYIVIGCLKPGIFRLMTVMVLLAGVAYGARHIYNSGHLGRVRTIHCARWVFVNQRKQMFFASNYDGSQESYMDDFINKVGWGLNLLFSNGVGYPRTRWLIKGGAANEQKFEYYIFRHQLPIDVWYKAYPGLTAFDLRRNSLVRDGLRKSAMSDNEVREWLNLL
jgi:hypothetical protein